MKKKILTVLLLSLSVVILTVCEPAKREENVATESVASTAQPAENLQPAAATAGTGSTAEQPITVTTTTKGQTVPAFTFETMEHNFGEIKQGVKVKKRYNFTNSGTAPLIVSNVQASCGCTTTDFTKTEIAPGDKGFIELEFDSNGKTGEQVKTATISSNVPGASVQVYLKGSVKTEDVAGPFKQ